MKVLLKTTSAHMYVDAYSGDEIAFNRPSVVRATEFINKLAAAGKVKVISNELQDAASDKHFTDHLKGAEGDIELAVASFLSEFALVKEETDPKKLKAAQAGADAERQKREAEEAAAAAAAQKQKDEQEAATQAAAAAAKKGK